MSAALFDNGLMSKDVRERLQRHIDDLKGQARALSRQSKERFGGDGGVAPEDTNEGKLADAIQHAIVCADLAPKPFVATHRHRKRGTEYAIVGEAQVQVATGEDGLRDDERAIVYRGRDGRLWVRRRSEFYDGRFETL